MTSPLVQATFEFALRMGDSDLVLAQRLSAWLGHGPIIEEDMASANIALDLLGQARLWYGYAVELEGGKRSEDDLAYLRDAPAWRNLLLVEQPNGNYGDTVVRQFLFDAWHRRALEALTHSHDARVAEIAHKSVKEVAYHVRRSADLVIRLGDGTDKSHDWMQAAVTRLWPYSGEMFAEDAIDLLLIAAHVAPSVASLESVWQSDVDEVLREATLAIPLRGWMQAGGKSGRHSEHLGHLLSEMQFLQRAYPGAQW